MLAADFPIGAAIALPQTLGERARLLTKHFTRSPRERAEVGRTQPTQGAFRYTDADALVAFAKANNCGYAGTRSSGTTRPRPGCSPTPTGSR